MITNSDGDWGSQKGSRLWVASLRRFGASSPVWASCGRKATVECGWSPTRWMLLRWPGKVCRRSIRWLQLSSRSRRLWTETGSWGLDGVLGRRMKPQIDWQLRRMVGARTGVFWKNLPKVFEQYWRGTQAQIQAEGGLVWTFRPFGPLVLLKKTYYIYRICQ